MAVPNDNLLQAVRTYNRSGLLYLQNFGCMIHTANKKFDNFQNITGQLGSTVGLKLPYRWVTQRSLTVSFQPIDQRLATLTVDQPINTSYAWSAEQFIFNLAQEGEELVKGAIKEIAPQIERDIASLAESVPYRFYGHGEAITSAQQLASAKENMSAFGLADGALRGYLPNLIIPSIAGTMQNQFVPMRNEAVAHKWMIGEFADVDWYRTNVLPTHTAGSVGQAGSILTVVSTNEDANGNITAITFSGAANNDPLAIAKYDSLYCIETDINFLTFVGHFNSNTQVQLLSQAASGSDGGGLVTVSFTPTLNANSSQAVQNINIDIVPGMRFQVLNSHICALMVSDDALYLAMPRLPTTSPFESHSEQDEQTGASFRSYYGYKFGENFYGLINDAIWGKLAISDYLQKIVIPLSQIRTS